MQQSINCTTYWIACLKAKILNICWLINPNYTFYQFAGCIFVRMMFCFYLLPFVTYGLLQLCVEYGFELHINFNQKKSYLMQASREINIILTVLLPNSVVLQLVPNLKYLSVWFFAGKTFCIDTSINRTKF